MPSASSELALYSAGLQFAAVGRLIYEEAKRQGLGMHIPMEWFHQDIRN